MAVLWHMCNRKVEGLRRGGRTFHDGRNSAEIYCVTKWDWNRTKDYYFVMIEFPFIIFFPSNFWGIFLQSGWIEFTFHERLGWRIDQVQTPPVLDVLCRNVTVFTPGADRERLVPVHTASLTLRAANGHLPVLDALRPVFKVTYCMN